MRVMTYNIRHGQGEDGWVSNARVAKVIAEANVDIVGLNEVWRMGDFFHQPAAFERLLATSIVFERNVKLAFLEQGNMVSTRGDIKHHENIELPSWGEMRSCLLARIELDGEEVAFGSAHLSLNRKMRARQVRALVEVLPRDVPLVLAGDMNCLAHELDPLKEFLTVVDAPATYPAFWPQRALDHIAFSSHWELEHVSSVDTKASDHRPVVAQLKRTAQGAG
ncbi:MAG: hypothetical protein HGB10_05025 [Coriobacteriia bacterium]|nr:hypothetical protein [Coriobacteriia bacterium]